MSTRMQARVNTSPVPAPSFAPAKGGLLGYQRLFAEAASLAAERDEERQEQSVLQRWAANQAASATMPPIVHEALRSPGQSLDSSAYVLKEPHFDHDFSRVPVRTAAPMMIQAKLTIGEPGDKYEQEADRVADLVMSMPEPRVQRQVEPEEEEEETVQTKPLAAQITPLIQRQVEPEEEEEQEKLIQAKLTKDAWLQRQDQEPEEEEEPIQAKSARGQVPQADPGLQAQIRSLRGSGRTLSQSVRSFFEPRFGHDFGKVRVHTGARAAQSARAVNALAYTVGRDVVFGAGQYAPRTAAGQRTLAHELTHVVQQSGAMVNDQQLALLDRANNEEELEYEAEMQTECVTAGHKPRPVRVQRRLGVAKLQRLGDPTQAPPGMACPIATDTPAGGADMLFPRSVVTLSPARKAKIASFVSSWHAGGANADVRIDGYASAEGPQPLNWRLSCNRVLAVRDEMVNPSTAGVAGIPASFITFFAQGETDEFSTALPPNRRVVITTTLSPSPTRACGPNVTAQVPAVWSRIQSDFRGFGFFQKEAACRHLVQPVVQGPSDSYVLNEDAFDTLGLFQGTASYLRRPPYHPPCAQPGTSNPARNADPFDPGHEDPATCSNTVQIGSSCWLSGTPNYGTFGIMTHLCYDWMSPLIIAGILTPALSPLAGYAILFSRTGMAGVVRLYKTIRGDDPTWPVAWAEAAYDSGPSATVSGTNRPNCPCACAVPYSGNAFDYAWEPSKPRPSWSH